MTALASLRRAGVGVAGAGLLAGALLFGGAPAAHAAPPAAPGTTFEASGPHGAPDLPLRPGGGGHGWGGGGHGWGGHGGWAGHGGWGGHPGGWGWGHPGRGWGHPGWGWGHPGWGRPWWNWWW